MVSHLEAHVKDGEDIVMRGEEVRVTILAEELAGSDRVRVDGLEHELLPRVAVLGQVDAGEPTFANLLNEVIFFVQIELFKKEWRFK